MFVVADVGDSLQRASDEFFAWIPNLAAFVAVLLIGWIVSRVVASIVRRGLVRVRFSTQCLAASTGGSFISKVTNSPSKLLSQVAFWLVFLGTLSIAVDVLGYVATLENLVAAVWSYMPNVLAALLIFVVAGAIAAAAATFAQRFMGDTPTGRIVATVAPILVMTIATFMILDQLQIAETIVTITYAALIGAIALGAALAFGLGGRERRESPAGRRLRTRRGGQGAGESRYAAGRAASEGRGTDRYRQRTSVASGDRHRLVVQLSKGVPGRPGRAPPHPVGRCTCQVAGDHLQRKETR